MDTAQNKLVTEAGRLDQIVIEAERLARLVEMLAAVYRRLTPSIKADLDECLFLVCSYDEGSD